MATDTSRSSLTFAGSRVRFTASPVRYDLTAVAGKRVYNSKPEPGRSRILMPSIDTRKLKVVERLPGWKGRFFHSGSMTFAHYEFTAGSSIHEHFHPEEEVYEILEGEIEITIDGTRHLASPGIAAIVPPNSRHSVRALTDGRLIVVDHPARPEFG
jgi:mannose-6-phosphate isomerase-like protein (cupin superfamily)